MTKNGIKNHRTDQGQCDGKKESSNEALVKLNLTIDYPSDSEFQCIGNSIDVNKLI